MAGSTELIAGCYWEVSWLRTFSGGCRNLSPEFPVHSTASGVSADTGAAV